MQNLILTDVSLMQLNNENTLQGLLRCPLLTPGIKCNENCVVDIYIYLEI